MAVSSDQSFLLVAESNRYRIRRHCLSSSRAGEEEIFVENLPGFPDNISLSSDGIFWVGLPSPRKADVDAMYARPFLRRALLRLPQRLMPEATAYGCVLGLDEAGNMVRNLQDPSGSYREITAAVEHEEVLYLGSIAEDAIGRLALN